MTGGFATLWNGTFGIYEVTEFGFRDFMKKAPPPDQPVPGSPTCVRLTFPFDEVIRALPVNVRIHIGPGVFRRAVLLQMTHGAGSQKSGQRIVGAGIDVITLQFVGAENADLRLLLKGKRTR